MRLARRQAGKLEQALEELGLVLFPLEERGTMVVLLSQPAVPGDIPGERGAVRLPLGKRMSIASRPAGSPSRGSP